MEPITRAEQFLARAAGDPGEDLTPLTRQEHFLKAIADAISSGGGGGSSVTVDSALSGSSENPVQNKVVKAALDGKADEPTVVAVSGSTPSIAPENNKVYECGELTSLTVSNFPVGGKFWIWFTSGATATTVIGIENGDGTTFQPEANKVYKIAVEDGFATFDTWSTGGGS